MSKYDDPVPWEELVKRTIDGDLFARDQLCEESKKRLERWGGTSGLSLEDCDDVRQGVLEALLDPNCKWLRTWEPGLGRRFPMYLRTKATFDGRDKARKDNRWDWVYDEFLELLPEREGPSRDLIRIVFEELGKLAEKDRKYADAIWSDACGMLTEETAAKDGVDRQNIYNWRHRGLAKLKAALTKRLGYDVADSMPQARSDRDIVKAEVPNERDSDQNGKADSEGTVNGSPTKHSKASDGRGTGLGGRAGAVFPKDDLDPPPKEK